MSKAESIHRFLSKPLSEQVKRALEVSLNAYDYGINLDEFQDISNADLELIASCGAGTLKLNGLRSIDREQAILLRRYKGSISLNGLNSLSLESARILSQRNRFGIELDGLDSLTTP